MLSDPESILRAYLIKHPDEATRQERIGAYLQRNAPAARIDRRNFDGHLTASGIVVDRDARRVLLIHHVGLDCWLQPGGHVEATDQTLVDAARREVEEETGLPAAVLRGDNGRVADDADGAAAIPLDIDSHDIPARPSKGEAAHTHHDFRYVFFVRSGDQSLSAQLAEVHDAQWWPLAEAAAKTDLGNVMKKVERLLAGGAIAD